MNVTFVNYLGQRTTLPGRVGQTLLTLAQEHDYNWLEGVGLTSLGVWVPSLNPPCIHELRNASVLL